MADYIDKVNFYNEGGGLQKSVPIKDSDTAASVSSLTKKVSTNTTKISSLTTDLDTAERNIANLTTRVGAAEGNITKKAMNNANRKWYLFGDSLTAIEEGFVSKLKAYFGSRLGVSAQGGMKYSTNAGSGYYTFSNMLDKWLPSIASKESYTDVLIELGSNDVVSYNPTNFASGFNAAIDKVKKAFPNATIHLAIVGKNMLNSQWNTRLAVINNIIHLGGLKGCCWVPGNENIIIAKNETFDTIHPTTAGHDKIAASLLSYMCGGEGAPSFVASENTVSSGLQGLQITEWYDGGKYFCKVQGTIHNDSGFKIPGVLGITGVEIGKVNLSYCHRDIAVSGFLQASLTVLGTRVQHCIPCTIAIVPSNDASTTCSVLLVASYQDYYRDSSGAAKLWTDGFLFTDGIFNGQVGCIDA